jgi:hypothetical protein
MNPRCFLDDIEPLDWTDLGGVAVRSQQIVRKIANDQQLLKQMVRHTLDDPELLSMCGHKPMFDKLVLYDDLARGIRLRLHFTTDKQDAPPHDHRFSFSAYILHGRYEHTWHSLNRDTATELDGDSLEPAFETVEVAGACYTMHHSVIHTTVTTPDTISLFLRGPAEKENSSFADSQAGETYHCFGAHQETAEHLEQERLARGRIIELSQRLERLRLVA